MMMKSSSLENEPCCSKDCKKNTETLNKKITELSDKLFDANNMICHYKLALAQVESRIVEYKEREVKYYEKIKTLEFHNESNNECIEILKKKLETLKEVKEGVDRKLAGLLKASKDLDNLIESQRSDKNKDGLGYSVVPPPLAQLYLSLKKDLSWTGLPECADDTVTDYSRPSPTVESTSGDDQNRNSSAFENGESTDSILSKPAVKFVKAAERSTTNNVETVKKPSVRYAELYRKPSKKSTVRGVKKGTARPQNNTHKSMPPRPAIHRPYRPPMRPMRPNMNVAQPKRTSFYKPAHSYNKRPFQETTQDLMIILIQRVQRLERELKARTPKVDRGRSRPFHRTSAVRPPYRAPWVPTVNRNLPPVNRKFSPGSRNFPTANRKFPTASRKFPTGSTKCSTTDMGIKGKAVKPSACWFWKPLQNLSNKGPKNNSVSVMFKKYTYIDTQGRLNGCSRHMTGNISYLSDYEPFDRGYVSFGQGGCKITRKGTIKTDKLEFENVYFVKDLKRLGHLNFKTMNKLVRHNLVRGQPTKYFENNHTCTACLKGKQHKASLTDDFSRFTWTFFLKSKDETSGILKKFIIEIENLKDLKVKIIRCDNGREFRNKEMNDFCSQKGIKREFSNARSPQQNSVAERRNKTLIEAARTMLDDAKLPESLRKKGDEGYFIRYSMSSKAFRVFNKRTRRVEENLHVEFLENKAIEKGSSPNWLFDIDSLTKSMNYMPVDVGAISTNLSGTKDAASQEVKKNVSSLRYIALPNWAHDTLLEFSLSKPQDHCSTEVLEGSGNLNPTASTSNPPADQMETLAVETPIPTDPESPAKVYKVEKAMYGLHQAPRACAIPPPPAQLYLSPKKDLSWTGLLECADDTITNYNRPSPTIESTSGDDQNRNPSVYETVASPITPKPFIKFVKPKDSQSKSKTGKTESPKKPPVKKRVRKSFTPKPVAHRPCRPSKRPVKTNMNDARPNRTSFNKHAHSYANRPFHRTSAVRSPYRAPWVPTVNRNFPPVNRKFSPRSRNFPTANRKFTTASRKFPTSSTKCSTADMGMRGKAGSSQNNNDDKGYWDSGCSRHITGNIPYLSDFEPFDREYVSFGQGGCKITGKGTIKTECIVLGRDFKLLDDANILLRTLRQHNMYSIDLNNIVPHRDLTCLVAKASADECMLWHMRLGHLNFKTMNKLVRHNLVRGLPTKCFENNHTCTACLNGKQHKASYLLTKPFDARRFQYLVCKLFLLLGKLSTVSVFLGFGLTFAGTSKNWGVLRILMISLRLIPLSEHNTDFYPMVDFIEASPLRIETTDEGTQILATVDGIHKIVSKSSLRRNLKLQDEEGISSLPDMELFENLTLMGYNISPNQKFTFQKGLFPFLPMLVQQGEGSGTPTEPHHTPSPEALSPTHTTHTSPTLPPVTTTSLPTVTQSDTPIVRQYIRRTRIAQSSIPPTVADESASPLRDASQWEACPTDSGFIADQDRATIDKSSTLPHDSAPLVTSHVADDGTQEVQINRLKERVNMLEDRKGVAATRSKDDVPIKGRSMDEGEAATERISDDSEEMVTILTSMNAATVLASEVVDVPNGSGSIPTASTPAKEKVPTGSDVVPTGSDVVPTASPVFATATVVTPYRRKKGKEVMVESETLKKQKVQEQIDAQVAKELEEQLKREDQRRSEQIARDAEIARIHDEEELQIMIDGLNRNNETVAKYLQEYHQFALELPIETRIELITDLVKYQYKYANIYKCQSQQRKPMTKKQKRDYYMVVIKNNLGWKVKDFRGMTFEEVEAKFNSVWKQMEDFIPMGSKEEAERIKRKGLNLEQESAKKQKTSEEVPEEAMSPE
nr:hypothetical protein [Tanacetum cinerariifolium]